MSALKRVVSTEITAIRIHGVSTHSVRTCANAWRAIGATTSSIASKWTNAPPGSIVVTRMRFASTRRAATTASAKTTMWATVSTVNVSGESFP